MPDPFQFVARPQDFEPPSLSPTAEASVLVVAEHAVIRAALGVLLNRAPGLAVVGEAEDVRVAVPLAERLAPDVVLLDALPRTLEGKHAVSALRAAVPRSCLLCLAHAAAMSEGGAEFRSVSPDTGIDGLCLELGTLLGDHCASCLLRSQCPVSRLGVALSPRERQVAVRVARGMSSKQIAAALGIRVRTVNTYRESLARKLGASSPAVVTRYVLENGLDAALEGGTAGP